MLEQLLQLEEQPYTDEDAEWDAFVAAVLDGATIPVTLKDGVMALALAEAATQSVKTGRPVDLVL